MLITSKPSPLWQTISYERAFENTAFLKQGDSRTMHLAYFGDPRGIVQNSNVIPSIKGCSVSKLKHYNQMLNLISSFNTSDSTQNISPTLEISRLSF